MNTALAILAHALRMLVFDTANTLRVLMPAIAVVMAGSLAIAFYAPDIVSMLQDPARANQIAEQGGTGIFLIAALMMLLGYAYMAILWHRHVLLNGAEGDDTLNPGTAVFFGYIWRAIVVGLVQVAIAFPATLVIGTLAAATGGTGAATGIIGLLGSVFFIWIALRFSVVLPAASLGYAMPVRESWALTKPMAAELAGVAALLIGLNMLIAIITSALLPSGGVLMMVAGTVTFIVEGLIFVSVLTTLYGHLVEGRSLGQ